VVDTTILLNGKNDFCTSDPAWGILSVNNALTTVQWYDGTNPIPGATGFNYRPLVTGNYWAQIQQNGCTNSTGTGNFKIHRVTLASFTTSKRSGCVPKKYFIFYKKSKSKQRHHTRL